MVVVHGSPTWTFGIVFGLAVPSKVAVFPEYVATVVVRLEPSKAIHRPCRLPTAVLVRPQTRDNVLIRLQGSSEEIWIVPLVWGGNGVVELVFAGIAEGDNRIIRAQPAEASCSLVASGC